MKKIFLLLLFVLLVLILYFLTPIRHYLSQEGFTQLEVWIRAQGFLAPFSLVIVLSLLPKIFKKRT